MISYLIHISILVVGFFLFYKLFLESETFFRLNRWVLLAGILLAFTIPLIQVPEQLAWKIDLDVVSWMQQERKPAEEADEVYVVLPKQKKSSQKTPSAHEAVSSSSEKTSLDKPLPTLTLSTLVWYVYVLGIGVFLLNLCVQIGVLLYRILKMQQFPDGKFRIIELHEDKAPYSFINYIFINPAKYDWNTYEQILQHEKVHISQKHSIDLFLAELLIVVQWFNPFAWWYRNVLENNLEYLTDSKMIAEGYDRKAYQMSLVRVSVPDHPLSLTNNYNQSFLKKRITMMNAKKSSFQSLWKYFFLITLLGVSVLIFNDVHRPALAQIIKGTQANSHYSKEFKAPVAPVPMVEPAPVLAPEPILDMNVDIDVNAVQEVDAIPDVSKIRVNTFIKTQGDGNFNFKSGVWRAWMEGDQVCINFDLSDRSEGNYWMQSECFSKSELGTLPINQEGNFQVVREAGKVDFSGKFENNEGLGRFTFTMNTDFQKYLTQQGFSGADEALLFQLFMANMDKGYITYLKQNRFDNLNSKTLRKLAIHDVSKAQIDAYTKAFSKESLSLEQIIKLGIHDVSPEYIKSLETAGFKNLSAKQVVKAKIHDLDPEMVRVFAQKGYSDLSFEEMIKLSIHDVDVAYIESLEKLGYKNLSTKTLVRAKIHDVDPTDVKEFTAQGYSNLSIEEIIRLNTHDVDAAFIRDMKALGFSNLSTKELTNAKIHDISKSYIQELKNIGFSNLSMNELVKMSIHDVSASFVNMLTSMGFTNLSADQVIEASIHDVDKSLVEGLKSAGYANISFNQVIKASIHDVDQGFIKGLNDLGFKNIPFETVIRCRIHDVTPAYIKKMQGKGFNDLSLEKYIKLKIHGFDK